MKISKSSWHYRFMSKLGVQPYWRTNLCEYVRGFVIAVVKSFLLLIAALFALGTAMFIIYCMLYTLLTLLFGLDTSKVEWGVGVGFLLLACAFAVGYVLTEVHRRREYKPAGPFKQYIRDRHDKVCRIISFDE